MQLNVSYLMFQLSAAHRRLESLSNDHKNVCLAYNEEKVHNSYSSTNQLNGYNDIK